MDTTTYTHDPLNRVTSQTAGGTTTSYSYLGLASELTTETTPTQTKAYAYTPGGMRVDQATTPSGGTATFGYYTYNDHNDVEAVTGDNSQGKNGLPTATYGYTAYGQNIQNQFTGNDKNNATPGPNTTAYNSYRFNSMRWDANSGQYDMGFRNYDPGLNQFDSRDMYDGALADMGLDTNPFTGSQYAFASGNPISNIEMDGHMICAAQGACGTPQAFTGAAQNFAAHLPQIQQQNQQMLAAACNTACQILPQNDRAAYNSWLSSYQDNNIYNKPGSPMYLLNSLAAFCSANPSDCPDSLASHATMDWVTLGAAAMGPGLGLAGSIRRGGELAGPPAELGQRMEAAAEEDLARLECGESFAPATRVLRANGRTTAIDRLKPGDKVLATNTKTGKTQAEKVTAVLVRHDTDLYNLTIRSGRHTEVIHTTHNHLFWDPYQHRWIASNKLTKGEHLRTPNGTVAVADGGTTPKVHDGWMWDLTVPGNNDHDFYVLPAQQGSERTSNVEAGNAPVLVHNNDPACEVGSKISPQKQGRHLQGDRLYNGGGYFTNLGDAQEVLDAYHSGDATVLGRTPSGNIVVKYDEVTGFNNNPANGYTDQPTNVFMIKGTRSVSVVPINPNWSG